MFKKTWIWFILLLLVVGASSAEPLMREATGVVLAKRSVTLASNIIRKVEKIHINEGGNVEKGMLLIQYNDREHKADLAYAEASLRLANTELAYRRKIMNRTKKLTVSHALSRERLDDDNFSYSSALERVNQAKAIILKNKAIVEETRLFAPFKGVITLKDVELGQLTQPGKTLLVLEDHSEYKVRASVKEKDILFIKKGQSVEVIIDALDNYKTKGKVKQIIPSANNETHNFIVEVILPAYKGVMPGMFVKLEFSMTTGE